MILEIASLTVKSDQTTQFEAAFIEAAKIIACSAGYVSHTLQRCIERPNGYVLLVQWQTLEDHTIGFRQSAPYLEWKALLHHFYDPFPTVEHFSLIHENTL